MRLFLTITAFAFCGALFAQTNNYYTVKFPDDKTYIGCGNVSVPVEMPVITNNTCNFNVGIARFDQVFTTNDNGTCYKIFRRWRLTDKCHPAPNDPFTVIENPASTDIGPTAYGTPANHGMLEYTQIIKVYDNVPPVFLGCPSDTVLFCDLTGNDPSQYGYRCEGPVNLSAQITDACSGNDLTLSYRLYLDLDGNGSLETFVNSNSPNSWPIAYTTGDTTLQGTIQFPTGYGFPYGLHMIEWVAGDHCGNEQVCKYFFRVRDCKAPTIACHNGLSVNIMQTGMITLWATDFMLYTHDNCTPDNLIKIGIRKAGTGTGFPENATSVTFDCSELGIQPVEVWVKDEYGNADYCLTYLNVQDNMASCAPAGPISGQIMQVDQEPFGAGAVIALKNASGVVKATATADAQGQFELVGAMAACGYTLTAQYDQQAAEGVTVFDAVLLDAHLADAQPFSAGWQWPAADTDQNHNLTDNDAQEIVKVAVLAQPQFTHAPSWKLIETDALSAIPPAETAAAAFCIPAYSPYTAAPLTAVKTGDLDASAASDNLSGDADDRAPRQRGAAFRAPEIYFENGNLVYVPVFAPHTNGFCGFQFTMQFDPAIFSLYAIQPGLISADQTAYFAEEGRLTAGWRGADAFEGGLYGGQEICTFVFQAHQAGKTSETLRFDAGKIASEAYTRFLQRLPARLDFDPVPLGLSGPTVGVPHPNPTRIGQTTQLKVWLNTDETVEVSELGASGEIVQSLRIEGVAGENLIEIPMLRAGMRFIRIATATQGATVVRVAAME